MVLTMKIEIKTEIPGPKSRELMELRNTHVARGPFHTTPIFAASAQDSFITDVDGNCYLDFAAGIGVMNVGHSQAGVVSAVTEQVEKFTHTSFNVVAYEGYVRLCQKLNQALPGDFAKKSFLSNSGAEAVENAIKIARTFTKRQAVVCFSHAYHGRTYMAMTLTAKAAPYKLGFGPFNSDVYRAPFPYCYRWPTGSDETKVSNECFAEFARQVQSEIGADQVAAVIIEPVLGEGGFVPAPKLFLQKLREFCTQNGIVLIFDEVQTGFGRTGTLFASQQLGVAPDMTTSAKGLGAGLPISAVIGRADIMDAPGSGGIGGTYSGSPLACASALAVFDLFADGKLLAHANSIGDHLSKRMEHWQERFPNIGDTRGLGPMRAIELVKDRVSKEPLPQAAKDLIKYGYEHGLIIMNAGTFGNVLRFLVPLCTTLDQLDQGLLVVEAGLEKVLK